MRFKTISLSRGGTINTGNFNNKKFDVSAVVEVEPDEDVDDVYARLQAWVNAAAAKEAKGA